MTRDHVALLGTKGGPAIRPGSSMPTSSLLSLGGERIVVDCGLGVARGLVDQGMALKDLSTIFVTHLHSDHYLELGPLLHTAWTAGLDAPVTVWGPEGLAAYWDAFCRSMAADIDLRIEDEGRPDLRGLARVHVIDPGAPMAVGTVSVEAMRVAHPPLVDCFALSFRAGGRHVVFSGDTAPVEGLAAFACGADLLVHEAMLEAALPALLGRIGNASGEKLMAHFRRSHTFAQDAAALAAEAGVARLALHHRLPADDPDYGEADWIAACAGRFDGTLIVGRDGLRIDL